MSGRVVVYGIAVAGLATLRALTRRGIDAVAVDDVVTDSKRRAVRELGVDLVEAPDERRLAELIDGADVVAPAPGVPETHPVIDIALARGRRIVTELDLAYEWERNRVGGPRPVVAVTGTDGKTTTTTMAAAMIEAAGRRTVACGNTEVPMVEALDLDVDCFVVEATSFRLAFCSSFRAEASAWLNLAPDHLDWHRSLDSYEAAKARLWEHVRADDVAIGWSGDPIVMRHLERTRCRRRTFAHEAADYCVVDGELHGPGGRIAPVESMSRRLPHDVTNALCASAVVLESGLGDVMGIARALGEYRPPHHRIEFVGESNGVEWYDDSKATTPHAVRTALRGFERVVLIAGGRNKGLDLSSIASEAHRVRAVVAIGEATGEIRSAFADLRPVESAESMADAVAVAARLAEPGDVVLLSPGCTSFDWYGGYAERGDDFVRCWRERVGVSS